jgi:hypothetical protein
MLKPCSSKDTTSPTEINFMKTKVTLLALAWLASGVALAQAPTTPPANTARMDRMALLLDLDDSQKTQLEQVLKEQHEQRLAAREAARASGQRPSREEMKAAHEQARQELHTKLSGFLNETQLKKFDALREGRGHGRHGRHDKAERGSKDATTPGQ